MRLSSILSEAWRGIMAGSARFVTIVITLTLLSGGAAAIELRISTEILNTATQYQAIGANILVLGAPDGIDGTSCDNLSDLYDVQASGAIREIDALVVSALPDTQTPRYAITSGFAKVLKAKQDASQQGLLISNELASTLNLQQGDTLALKDGQQALVKGTYDYPDDGRMPGYSYAALEEVPDADIFDACWVSIWPQSDQVRDAIWSALTPTAKSDNGSSTTLSQLNSSQGESFNGAAMWMNRLTIGLPALAATLGALFGAIIIRLRRMELASALHCGVSKSALVLQLCIESSAAILICALVTVPLSYTLSTWLVDAADCAAVAATIAQPCLTAYTAYVLSAMGNVALIKERHLFTYFKER